MLASQGYASIRDLGIALGISRAGVYAILRRITPPPKWQKVGVKVYIEVQVIVDYIKAGGTAHRRAPKDRRGTIRAVRAGKAAR